MEWGGGGGGRVGVAWGGWLGYGGRSDMGCRMASIGLGDGDCLDRVQG